MVSRRVDVLLYHRTGRHQHIRVMDKDAPKINEDKEAEVHVSMQGKEEDKKMVWYRLGIAIDRVEGMRGEWSRNEPFVMRFVDSFVDERNVQPTVDPVDTIVGEEQEHWGRKEEICPSIVFDIGIEPRITAHFTQEPWEREQCHAGETP